MYLDMRFFKSSIEQSEHFISSGETLIDENQLMYRVLARPGHLVVVVREQDRGTE